MDEILREHFPEILYRFSARADLVTEQSLWELKCTSQLTLEHKLQLVIYAWLYECRYELHKKKKDFHLFNIKTNEHLKLDASMDQLTKIIIEIIKGKTKSKPLTDDEFLLSISK